MDSIIDQILSYENGQLSEDETIKLFEQLYLNDSIFELQGAYQRKFKELMDSGLIDFQKILKQKHLIRTEQEI